MSRQSQQALVKLHAAQMRSWLTPAEAALWAAISRRQLGVQFRRQVVIVGFIADFCAPAARLVVEVDGRHHEAQRGADARRDAKLRRLGYRVLRLSAEVVLGALPRAVEAVRQALAAGG